MRVVSIFGVTGSIGANTLALVAPLVAEGRVRVAALSARRNALALAQAARRLRAEVAVLAEEEGLATLREALAGTGIRAAAGPAALAEAAAMPADWVMSAIVGAAGIAPGFAALAQGATLALANKETMVAAGAAARALAQRTGARILPVDSEHSAIFQILEGRAGDLPERVILTASGGPFRKLSLAEMAAKTPAEAVAHPNWDMGQRISIDSASMFNKALEVIEAHELFDIPPERIEVVIHPQSIIHSLVGFADGAIFAHMGPPDMKGPIGYALGWPERPALDLPRLDLAALGRLDFEAPDEQRFPALRLAREVLAIGGLAGAAFNAAKEAALDSFIAGEIAFTDMAVVVEAVLEAMQRAGELGGAVDLDAALAADQMARQRARAVIARRLAS